MNTNLLAVVTLGLTFFFYGCGGDKTAQNQSADSTQTINSSVASTNVAITGRLAELSLTNDSDWRGINLGDDIAKVKTIEKGKPFESDEKHIGYTIEFQNLETADMLYYQSNQKVSAIEVDLFLNSGQSVADYQKELEPYFTARFGTPKPADKTMIWTGKDGKSVTLTDVSKGKDFGLKVKIAQTGGVTTASAK
ncbi:hypothetical protein [Spirosoma sp.]|uniref:hypothetical protein n=1 Tax=Spirosoma sp. TaxID=1899569 RepID=UPI003B3BD09A